MESQPKPINDQTIQFNPWLEIWTASRRTMRKIVETNPKQYVYLLAVLSGVLGMPKLLQDLNKLAVDMGKTAPFTTLLVSLLATLVVGALIGLGGLIIETVLCVFTASWFGGKAKFGDVRAALAWSLVPNIPVRILQLVPILIALFLPAALLAGPLMTCFFLIIDLIQLPLLIWGIVIGARCLGEVEQFSGWRAFAAILSTGIFIVPIIVIVVVGGYALFLI